MKEHIVQSYATDFFASGPVYVDRVLLMPVPVPPDEPVTGTGTYSDPALFVGSYEITVPPGTPFVLPFSGYLGETYTLKSGYPDDVMLPPEEILNDNLKVTLDGRTIIDSQNPKDKLSKYYYATEFDEPILYKGDALDNGRDAIGIIWAQGLGFIHPPLSMGTHTLKLTSWFLLPYPLALPPEEWPDGMGFIYENTWTITVAK